LLLWLAEAEGRGKTDDPGCRTPSPRSLRESVPELRPLPRPDPADRRAGRIVRQDRGTRLVRASAGEGRPPDAPHPALSSLLGSPGLPARSAPESPRLRLIPG